MTELEKIHALIIQGDLQPARHRLQKLLADPAHMSSPAKASDTHYLLGNIHEIERRNFLAMESWITASKELVGAPPAARESRERLLVETVFAHLRVPRVFISYRHSQDVPRRALQDLLFAHQIESITDEDYIRAGKVVMGEIERCMLQSNATIILNSEDYMDSEWCRAELKIAQSLRVRGLHGITLFNKHLDASHYPIISIHLHPDLSPLPGEEEHVFLNVSEPALGRRICNTLRRAPCIHQTLPQ